MSPTSALLPLAEAAVPGGTLFCNLPAVPGANILLEISWLNHFTETFTAVYFQKAEPHLVWVFA